MALQTIVNGNVSEAEDMLARMTQSSGFLTRLQQAGLGVVHILLVSCEPLDPEELPVRLRPPPYNVTFPITGALSPYSLAYMQSNICTCTVYAIKLLLVKIQLPSSLCVSLTCNSSGKHYRLAP